MKHLLLALICAFAQTALSQAQRDSLEIVQVLKDDYRTMINWDINKHKSLCTDDYILIEDGEIWNMEKEAEHYRKSASRILDRKDYFDFLFVRILGNTAYTVYNLKSDISEAGTLIIKRWTESVVFRKTQGKWKIALIHSTPINKK
jgi:hypothetical protein